MASQAAYIVWALVAGWNIFTFSVTAHDKYAARRGKRRTPESRFCVFALALGGVGVLAAFYICRHKTRHKALLFCVWALSLLSYAVVGYGAWRLFEALG